MKYKILLSILAAALMLCSAAGCRRDDAGAVPPDDFVSETAEAAHGADSEAESAFPDTLREAMEREDFVVNPNDGSLLNGELWDAFIEAADRGEESSVTVVRPTIEGDPIYNVLTFRNGRYHLYQDCSHDKWGGGWAEADYACLERLETDGSVHWHLTDDPFGSDDAYRDYLEALWAWYDRENHEGDFPVRDFMPLMEIRADAAPSR